MGGDRKRHTTEMKHGFRYMLRAKATHQKAFQYSTLWDRFHQRFMSSFYARRSQKRQRLSGHKCLFVLLGSEKAALKCW